MSLCLVIPGINDDKQRKAANLQKWTVAQVLAVVVVLLYVVAEPDLCGVEAGPCDRAISSGASRPARHFVLRQHSAFRLRNIADSSQIAKPSDQRWD